jgi:hypothetical protein
MNDDDEGFSRRQFVTVVLLCTVVFFGSSLIRTYVVLGVRTRTYTWYVRTYVRAHVVLEYILEHGTAPGSTSALVRQQGYMLVQIVTEIHAPDLAVEGAGARVGAGGDGDHNHDVIGFVHHHGGGGGGGGGGCWRVRTRMIPL